MTKQTGIFALLIAIVVILFITLSFGGKKETTFREGAPSVLEGETENGAVGSSTEQNGETPPLPAEETTPPPESGTNTAEQTPSKPASTPTETTPPPSDISGPTSSEPMQPTVPEEAATTTEPEASEGPATTTEATTTEEVVAEEPEQAPLGDLVLHLMLDENTGTFLADSSGYGNNGELINTDQTVWQPGQIGSALKFDGMNDYAKIPNSDSLAIGAPTEGYTISFWFKDLDRAQGERQIIGKGGRSGPSPFIFRIDDRGHLSFRISDGLQADTIESDNSVVNGKWQYIVGVRDPAADRIRLYVDGTETGGLIPDTTTMDLSNTLDIFMDHYDAGTAYFFETFSIDDVRIYKKALSKEEIQQLFTEGKSL